MPICLLDAQVSCDLDADSSPKNLAAVLMLLNQSLRVSARQQLREMVLYTFKQLGLAA